MSSCSIIATIAFVAFAYNCVLLENQVNAATPLNVDVPRLKTAQDVCKVKSGVSDAVYEAAQMNNMDVNDRNLQCYTKCIFTEMGTMDENGNMSLESFVAELGEENKGLHGDGLLSCQKEVDDKDLCLKGIKLYQCFQKKQGDVFNFV